jgi:hypothetical protein
MSAFCYSATNKIVQANRAPGCFLLSWYQVLHYPNVFPGHGLVRSFKRILLLVIAMPRDNKGMICRRMKIKEMRISFAAFRLVPAIVVLVAPPVVGLIPLLLLRGSWRFKVKVEQVCC